MTTFREAAEAHQMEPAVKRLSDAGINITMIVRVHKMSIESVPDYPP